MSKQSSNRNECSVNIGGAQAPKAPPWLCYCSRCVHSFAETIFTKTKRPKLAVSVNTVHEQNPFCWMSRSYGPSSKAFEAKTGFDVEDILVDLYYWFDRSTKRKNELLILRFLCVNVNCKQGIQVYTSQPAPPL